MEFWKIALIVVAAVLFFALVFSFSMAILLDNVMFTRQDKNPAYKYFDAHDFNLKTHSIEVTYKGKELYAKVYCVKPLNECEKVVIFQHGFGAGSSSYMTEIAALAGYGYAVVACDACGCNNSEGKKVGGFYAGTEAVIATYIGVKRNEKLKDKKIVLIGHSWGAYSVCCAVKNIKVDGVIALSGFNAPAQCICDQLKLVSASGKFLAFLLHPFFFIVNMFRFRNGNAHAARRIDKSGVKTLLIHGGKDRTVPLKHSVLFKAKGANVEKLLLEDKRHNPYNTIEGEDTLRQLMDKKTFENDQEKKEFYSTFDWKKATEEDSEVMGKIDSFIKSV
ncbi:MAG: alpha/beta hydrolase [Candidatus Coproplasma sp.]